LLLVEFMSPPTDARAELKLETVADIVSVSHSLPRPLLRTSWISESEGDQALPRWRSLLSAARTVVDNNSGVLLVTGSQAFFALMNFSVKILNTIDPPVSAFQVGFLAIDMRWRI